MREEDMRPPSRAALLPNLLVTLADPVISGLCDCTLIPLHPATLLLSMPNLKFLFSSC